MIALLSAAATLQSPPSIAPEWLWAGSAVLGLALAIALALALGRVHRRAQIGSTREIVRAAEEIAEGRYDRLPSLSADDPLAPAASALGRVAAAVRGRTHELERRHRFLEEMLGAARDTALLLVDPDGDVRYASPGAGILLGWKSGEGPGEKLASLFANEEDYEALLPKLSRRSLKEGTLLQWGRLRRRNGETFKGELRINVFRSLPGGGEGFLLEVRDLSEEETLRADLQESEEKHRTLAERLPLGVFLLQDGRIVFANGALGQMLEAQEGLIGADFREYLAAEDLLHVLDRLRRAESGEEPSFEVDCRIRPARTRWPIEVILGASRIVYGGRPAVVGTVRDAGPDRGLLRQIRLSEAKLEAALGATEEAILLLSAAPAGGTVVLANTRFGQLFGLDSRSLAGLSLEELAERLAPAFTDPEGVRGALRGLRTSDGASEACWFQTAGGSSRTIELSSRLAHDPEGRPIGRLLSARDVTEQREHRRRLEREAEDLTRTRDLLATANRELAELNQQLQTSAAGVEKANRELRALDEMKSNLLANVSHELQTPLVSIKGYTEMILKGRLGSVTEEQRKGLEVSLRNIDRLIGMINNLLNFSRLEKDMAGMTISVFPLPPLVEEAMELVGEAAAQRRISLSSRFMTDELSIRADREKIAQVFINLIGNAVKYNRDGGQVQIDVRKGKKGYLIVDVRDSGIGIPRESLEKVFDRFYRVPSETPSSAPGSGIGLAIVRDILRMHGCIIKADSNLGEETVLTFTLPVANAERGEGPSSDAAGSRGSAGEGTARGDVAAPTLPREPGSLS